MKKMTLLFLSFLLVISLTVGCNQKTENSNEKDGKENAEQTAELAGGGSGGVSGKGEAQNTDNTVKDGKESTEQSAEQAGGGGGEVTNADSGAEAQTPQSTEQAAEQASPSPSPSPEPIPSPSPEPSPSSSASPSHSPSPNPTPNPSPEPEVENDILVMLSYQSVMHNLAQEGLENAAEDFGYSFVQFTNPTKSEENNQANIGNAITEGHDFILFPEFDFASTVADAQDNYEDVHFILLGSDGVMNENVTTFSFSEEQSGFIAGVAAAVELDSASFGFIGGMEISPVQSFNWGFQQGLAYANSTFGTSATIIPEHVVYQGTFNEVESGKQIALDMYADGVDCIFAAAGSLGLGVIDAAREVTNGGRTVWAVGVDYDQYNAGSYNGGSSVLTSAMKRYDTAAYIAAQMYYEDTLEGGVNIKLGIGENGVGIPDENPNLSEPTLTKVSTTIDKFINGEITILNSPGGLIP